MKRWPARPALSRAVSKIGSKAPPPQELMTERAKGVAKSVVKVRNWHI
jgi:hypothetical protein